MASVTCDVHGNVLFAFDDLQILANSHVLVTASRVFRDFFNSFNDIPRPNTGQIKVIKNMADDPHALASICTILHWQPTRVLEPTIDELQKLAATSCKYECPAPVRMVYGKRLRDLIHVKDHNLADRALLVAIAYHIEDDEAFCQATNRIVMSADNAASVKYLEKLNLVMGGISCDFLTKYLVDFYHTFQRDVVVAHCLNRFRTKCIQELMQRMLNCGKKTLVDSHKRTDELEQHLKIPGSFDKLDDQITTTFMSATLGSEPFWPADVRSTLQICWQGLSRYMHSTGLCRRCVQERRLFPNIDSHAHVPEESNGAPETSSSASSSTPQSAPTCGNPTYNTTARSGVTHGRLAACSQGTKIVSTAKKLPGL